MRLSLTLICSLLFAANAAEARVKRQATTEEPKKEESFEKELCKDKDAGEWFRLVAGEGDNCRDVIQCTSSVGFIPSKKKALKSSRVLEYNLTYWLRFLFF